MNNAMQSSSQIPSPPFRNPLRAPFIVHCPCNRIFPKVLGPAEPRHPLPSVKRRVIRDFHDHLGARFENLLYRTVHSCGEPGQTRRRTGQEDVLFGG